VETELGTLELGDPRLDARVKMVLEACAGQPEASLPKACESRAATKGAHRLLDNSKVTAAKILGAHREAVLERMQEQAVVLAVQDTTTLNLSTHPHTTGIGPVGNNKDKTVGLFFHGTLALCENGQALGLLNTHIFARDPKRFGTRPAGERNRLPVDQKESFRWIESLLACWQAALKTPGSCIINVADREADSYDLFWVHARMRSGDYGVYANEVALEAAGRVELLVRCQHNRRLLKEAERQAAALLKAARTKGKPGKEAVAAAKIAALKAAQDAAQIKAAAKAAVAEADAAQEQLFGHLAAVPAQGAYEILVPRKPGKKARTATLSLRFKQICVPPPPDQIKYHGHTEPLVLWVVEAREESPPQGEEAICWRLLSTMAVHDVASARLAVERYTKRWQIEIFHKILKSGCRAEDRQMESRERFERCLALDVIVAWRVLAMSKAGRSADGGGPVSQWLEEHEWKALWCYTFKTKEPPATPPLTRDAVAWAAALGGFLGRKGDGFPGPMTLWRGLQRLNDIASAYLLFA
jgi:hypothetical protein